MLLAIAIAVKLSSRGPVIYRSVRPGMAGKPFRCFKFRTMREHADQIQDDLESLNEKSGALFKIRHDPRLTTVGRFLRRFSLDELPQLVNVVRGEMSLVGPRPLPMRDFERLEEWHKKRYLVLPGITGLWQVSGRSELDFDDLVRLDFLYLERWSVFLDLLDPAQDDPRGAQPARRVLSPAPGGPDTASTSERICSPPTMPPTDRFVISFAAEPPQESLPYGRWADTLREHFLARGPRDRHRGRGHRRAGRDRVVPGPHLRRPHLRPAVARTTADYELFGFVSFGEGSRGPSDFEAQADFTSELAESNPDWKLDLNDDVIAAWRGEQGKTRRHDAGVGSAADPRRRGRHRRARQPGGRPVRAGRRALHPDRPRQLPLGLPRGQAVEQARRGAGVESLYVDDDDDDEDAEESDDERVGESPTTRSTAPSAAAA